MAAATAAAIGALALDHLSTHPNTRRLIAGGAKRWIAKRPQRIQARRQRRTTRRNARRGSAQSQTGLRNSSTLQAIRAPTSVGIRARQTPPVTGSSSGAMPVIHREFIYTILSSQTFESITIPGQPGHPSFGMWSSKIAQLFERYVLDSVTFLYIPSCATSTVGTIGMTPSYDAGDAAPDSTLDALNAHGAVHGSPWTQHAVRIDPKRVHGSFNRLFVRNGSVPSDGDIKTYDGFNLHLWTDGGVDDGTAWGRIAVQYKMRLFTPQPAAETISSAYYQTATALAATVVDDFVAGNGLVSGDVVFTGTEFPHWPAMGQYMCQLVITGTDLVGGPAHTGAGGTYNTIQLVALADGTVRSFTFTAVVQTNDAFRVQITSATTITDVTLFITQCDASDFADL